MEHLSLANEDTLPFQGSNKLKSQQSYQEMFSCVYVWAEKEL